MLGKIVDSLLLVKEVESLCTRYEQLTNQSVRKTEEILALKETANSYENKVKADLIQINSLNQRIRKLVNLETECINSERVRKELESKRCELREQINQLETIKLNVILEIQNYRESLAELKLEIDSEISIYRKQKQSDLENELNSLKTTHFQALEEDYKNKATALEERLMNLEGEGKLRAEEVRANLETTSIQASQAIVGLEEEVRAWEQRIDCLERNYRVKQNEIKNQAVDLASIEIEKRKLALDYEKLEYAKYLSFEKHKIVEEFKPRLIKPYLEQIENLEEEIIRLNSMLTVKSGKLFNWTLEQIRAFMVKERNGRLEPNHLRIAGESESGKSHTINQFISEGLQHFGVYCNYEILDPFPSQTEWEVTPTISNDCEGVLDRLKHWEQFCNDETPGLEKPLVIVIDEIDRMILKFGKETVSALRSIWGGGRHKSLFLWVIGQNANVKRLTPLDWSDLDNCGQIYLNSSGLQYIKNGLNGQETKRLEGELRQVKKETEFYAVVKVKGLDPYAIARPYNLFSSDTGPGKAKEISTVLRCPHCHSENVKRDGKLNGKQRVHCKDCGKKGSTLSHP